MKRLLLIGALVSAGLFIVPAESQAACGRVGHRVRAVLRAPFKLGQAIRARRCNCDASCECQSVCTSCSPY